LRDFEIFRDQNTQDDAKAGLLLSTCKFLIEQGESLSLLGVEFDTDSLGAPRTRLEETQIYLQKLITKTKADRDKKQTESETSGRVCEGFSFGLGFGVFWGDPD